jgi:crossover junction endodeoxyribonuclease RuvC
MSGDVRLIACGTIKCTSKTPIHKRINIIYATLLQLAKEHKVTKIAVEDQFGYKNPKTLKALSNVKATAMLIAAQLDLPYMEFAPTYIKERFTGSGKASKEAMIASAKAKYQIDERIDDNTADAIGIAYTQLVEDAYRN